MMYRQNPEIKDLNLAGFREIKGFPNIVEDMYYVNFHGDVYSKYKKGLLSPMEDKDGYLRVSLRTKDNKLSLRGVHQLVLHTFVGEPPKDMVNPTIDHIDRNNKNNTVSNLRYLSNHDNIMHRISAKGMNNGGNIYSEYTIKEIIDTKIKHPEIGCSELHRRFKVSRAQIFRIITKKIWKYLTNDVIFDMINFFSDPKLYNWGYKNETDELSVHDIGRSNKTEDTLPEYTFFDNEYGIEDLN